MTQEQYDSHKWGEYSLNTLRCPRCHLVIPRDFHVNEIMSQIFDSCDNILNFKLLQETAQVVDS